MKYGYVRVSTEDQKIGRQIKNMIEQFNIDTDGLDPETIDYDKFTSRRSGCLFIDKMSGKDLNRPQFQDLLNTVQAGDTIIFDEVSRLGRKAIEVIVTVDELMKKGVSLFFYKEGIDPSTEMGEFFLDICSRFAQMERKYMLERTREGVALAKAQGKYKGKPALNVDKDNLDMIMSKVINGEMHYKKASQNIIYTTASGVRKSGVCLSTFYKLLDKWAIDNGYEKLNKNNLRYIKSTNENNVRLDTKKEYTDEDVPSDIFSDMNID